MYVDYRLSLGLNIKTKELNKSYLDILKEASNNNLGNIEYENSTELLEQMGAYMTTTRRDDLPSINHTYQGNYYLCIQKVFSETSNFAVTCTEESLKSFEKEKNILKKICNDYGLEYNEKNISIVIDSNNY